MKYISVIKAILSGFVWGLGQLLNRQYIKALFFFIIFAGFVGTELLTSSYFEETNPYDKLNGEDLGDNWYKESFLSRYVFNKTQNVYGPNQAGYAPLEEYIASVGGYDFVTEEGILQLIADDLLENNPPSYTQIFTGISQLADNFSDDAQFLQRRGTFYLSPEGEFYFERRIIDDNGDTKKVYVNTTLITNEINENDVIESIEGFQVYELQNKLYRESGTVYLQVKIDGIYSYINLLTEEFVPSIEANLTLPLNIVGPLYRLDGQFYEYFEPGLIYLSQRLQYVETPLTRTFRQALFYDYSLGIYSYGNAEFNRLLLKIYLNLNPDIKNTFETEYDNFFYDKAGVFVRSYWSVMTLGVANKINYTGHMSLVEAIAGQGLSRDDFSMYQLPGFIVSENIPLQGHVSTLILLEGLIGVIGSLFFFIFMIWSIVDAYRVAEAKRLKKIVLKDVAYFKNVYESSFEYIILSPAMFVLAFISIMPIVFGFVIAFTDIAGNESMLNRFDWVGFSNFIAIFDFSSGLGESFGQAFWRVLGWTVVWAILSTGTVFFGGFFQALILNSEKVVFRKFWRTVLILPWAIPALLSQMVFSVMFKELGFVNAFLNDIGIYDILFNWGMLGVDFSQLEGISKIFYLGYDNIQWFTNPYNPTFVRAALVVINIWLGFPYFMALMTGVMTAIDKTLYEAADIDGASGWQKIRLITMPLVLYSTAPILIMTFSGNFNNFGVIYFITGGGPNDGKPALGFAGDTDILISWMYKLTVDYSIYNMASVFSVLIFIFVGSITAWNLSRTRAFQED
jgi:arabinogalactan oligomer / maltooligosaccharide transport system permease protein